MPRLSTFALVIGIYLALMGYLMYYIPSYIPDYISLTLATFMTFAIFVFALASYDVAQ